MSYYKYYRKLKVLLRGSISSFVFRILYRKGFDISETLLIFGSSRSGSTWLAEIISSLPGHSQVFEPLNTRYVKQAEDAGVVKNTFRKKSARWEKGQAFLEQVLSGRLMNPWLASQIPVNKVFATRRLVVKFVRGNLLLDWMCANLPVLPPAMVIRHPCAIISSQLSKGWTPSRTILLANSYFDEHPEIRERCSQLRSPEEINALAWCLRYHAPLCIAKPYPYVLICYEKLVRDGVREIEKLFKVWKLEMTEDITRQLKKASDTVTHSSQIVSGKDPLAGWKTKLSSEQVSDILAVLAIFGMDFYGKELEPDYNKLYDFPDCAGN